MTRRVRRCSGGNSSFSSSCRATDATARLTPNTWWLRAITLRMAPGLLSSNRMKFSTMSRSRSCASMPFSSTSASTLPLSASSSRFHSEKCPQSLVIEP